MPLIPNDDCSVLFFICLVRSEHATADMFKELMKNNAGVDVAKAHAAGGGGEEDRGAGDDASAKDLLMRLPGVNVHNYRNVRAVFCCSVASVGLLLVSTPPRRVRSSVVHGTFSPTSCGGGYHGSYILTKCTSFSCRFGDGITNSTYRSAQPTGLTFMLLSATKNSALFAMLAPRVSSSYPSRFSDSD